MREAGRERFKATRQDAFAAALSAQGEIEGVHDGRGRPAPDRFRIYRNNVTVSLRDALRASFATTQRLAGEEFFDAAAVAYATANKPTSPMLFRYGDTFGDFLAALPGLDAYPFVPETARIEYARVIAYYAADTPALAADALATIAPEDLGNVAMTPHPATALLSVPHGGLAAWQANQNPPLPQTPAPAALITRPQMDVLVTALDGPSQSFTDALLKGAPLESAAAVDGLDLAATLGLLLCVGAFTAIGTLPN
ncbi:MAG: DNA-binding domain-containing protein [Pseudomonadota bacterium]